MFNSTELRSVCNGGRPGHLQVNCPVREPFVHTTAHGCCNLSPRKVVLRTMNTCQYTYTSTVSSITCGDWKLCLPRRSAVPRKVRGSSRQAASVLSSAVSGEPIRSKQDRLAIHPSLSLVSFIVSTRTSSTVVIQAINTNKPSNGCSANLEAQCRGGRVSTALTTPLESTAVLTDTIEIVSTQVLAVRS